MLRKLSTPFICCHIICDYREIREDKQFVTKTFLTVDQYWALTWVQKVVMLSKHRLIKVPIAGESITHLDSCSKDF
jgi:hypothetical protein